MGLFLSTVKLLNWTTPLYLQPPNKDNSFIAGLLRELKETFLEALRRHLLPTYSNAMPSTGICLLNSHNSTHGSGVLFIISSLSMANPKEKGISELAQGTQPGKGGSCIRT